MELTKIVQGVNTKLAGEMLTYEMLKPYLDEVIDNINAKLSSNFPVFSDFTQAAYPTVYPNYNFFPDKFIRTVVLYGAAQKFYTTDEEGINSARQYDVEYRNALFEMERDYIELVPTEYQVDTPASVVMDTSAMADTPFDFNLG